MDHPHIVKRKGHREAYDNHKVYGSCYAACINTGLKKDEAERICTEITSEIDQWIAGKDEVYSQEIFDQIVQTLAKQHKQASFMYETHRDVS